ncbi:hypothetical protein ACHAXS_010459 [Conticribra weissflogii]
MCLVLWGTFASTFVAGESRAHHIAYENPDRRQNRGLINKGNPEFPKSEAESTTPPTSTSSSNLFKNTRIIGGEEAVEDRYSYSVSLQAKNSAVLNNGHFCGGSLIAGDVVLTAAHCVDNLDTTEINIVVGRHGLEDDDGDVIPVDLEKSVLHPYWKQWYTLENEYDFALLYLTRPTTANAKFVKLNGDASIPENGINAHAIGWGDTNIFLDEITLPEALHEVELSVISNDECRTSGIVVEGILYSYLFSISDSMLCTFSEDKDACQGDSGGPLVVRGNDPMGAEDVQIGVTSWGLFCATNIFPGVYSRVSSAYSWIKSDVCLYSEDPPSHLSCETESTDDSAPMSASNLMPTWSPSFTSETFPPTRSPLIGSTKIPSQGETMEPSFNEPTYLPTATTKQSHEPSSNPSIPISPKPSSTPTSTPSHSFPPTSTPSLQASHSPSESPSRAIVPSSQPTSPPTVSTPPSFSPFPTSAAPTRSSLPSVAPSPSAHGRKSSIPSYSLLSPSVHPSSNPVTISPNPALGSNSEEEADSLLIPVSTVAEPEEKSFEGEVEEDVKSASTNSSCTRQSRVSAVTIGGVFCLWLVV